LCETVACIAVRFDDRLAHDRFSKGVCEVLAVASREVVRSVLFDQCTG